VHVKHPLTKKRYCEIFLEWKFKILTKKESGLIGDGLWGQNVRNNNIIPTKYISITIIVHAQRLF
jgi:hypothetical protein